MSAALPHIMGMETCRYFPGLSVRVFTRLRIWTSTICRTSRTLSVHTRAHQVEIIFTLEPCEATSSPEVLEDE